MKLKEFLRVCSDKDIVIENGNEQVWGVSYREVMDLLDYTVTDISTCGYERIYVTVVRESDNGRSD